MNFQELVALADRILSDEDDPETLSVRIMAYSAGFDRWAAGQLELFESHTIPAGITRDELEALLSKHGRVIERAQSLLGKTSVELKSLRSRGKGVIKYLDQMPKSISVSKGKRG